MEERQFGPIWFLPGENSGKYPFCHSIYIEGAGILVDPASDRRRLERLREESGVKAVWLTHWHEDHFMHLDLFDDLPLWMAAQDAPPLADLECFLDWYAMTDEGYRQHWRDVVADQFHFRPRRPTGSLKGGDRIALNGVTVEVIHSPGHTPGHLSLFFEELGILFLGDYDLTKFGPWYGDLYSSIPDVISSVGLLRKRSAGIWLTSHERGVFQEEPGQLWDEYLDVIQRREEKLLDFLTTPRTMDEIVDEWIVYGRPREPRGFFEFGERAIMGKHLEDLMARGVAERDGVRFTKP